VVFSELMVDPASGKDEDLEWLELHSLSADPLDMEGVFLLGEEGTGITLHGLILEPEGYLLLAASEEVEEATGITPDMLYDSSLFRLGNGDGLASLQWGETELDFVAYDEASWPIIKGHSLMKLSEDAPSAEPGSWCASERIMPDGDFGSPGAENGSCMEVPVELDKDSDGWLEEEGDCDDTNPSIYPSALEILDGLDQDCDGVVDELPPEEGELVIVEIMNNPDPTEDDFGEWFELWSHVGHPLELGGIVVSDEDGESFILDAFLLMPGELVVVGASDDLGINGSYIPDLTWAGHNFHLGNDADEIILTIGNQEIDAVYYDEDFPQDPGAAIALDPAYFNSTDNDDPDPWCKANAEYGSDGNLGSPGAINPGC
jgi:hypothetical protein